MSDIVNFFPIIALAATPVFIVTLWFFCGGSFDFIDLAQGFHDPLTDEEQAKLRKAIEDHLVTSKFKSSNQEDAPTNLEPGNPCEDVESGSPSPPACTICLTDYVNDDFISSSSNPECPHVFHKDCIVEWLMASAVQAECPICRREFLSLEERENCCASVKANQTTNQGRPSTEGVSP